MRTLSYKIGYESVISRIPGLFAYVEMDEKGNPIVHKATDSPLGCYGKIVENIMYDDGKVYTYKELIESYYNDTLEEFYDGDDDDIEERNEFVNNLKQFVEDGIGKIVIDKDVEELDEEENDLVPDFFYLASVGVLYNEMFELSLKCKFYEKHKETKKERLDREKEAELCCACVKYRRLGGKYMLEYYRQYLFEADKRAKRYYKCVAKDNGLKINLSLNLFESINDMGSVVPIDDLTFKEPLLNYDDEFDPEKSIVDGDITLKYRTTSQLTSLRRYEQYTNKNDVVEYPESGTDWLFFYRENTLHNLRTLNDDFGNIVRENTEEMPEEGEVVEDLCTYGDYIESIEISWASQLKILEDSVKFMDEINRREDDDGEKWIVNAKIAKLRLKNAIDADNGDEEDESVDEEILNASIGYEKYKGDFEKYLKLERVQDRLKKLRDSDPPSEDDYFNYMTNAIRIVYWTDVHLKAEVNAIEYDENLNPKVLYDKFVPDFDYKSTVDGKENYHGIKYTEVFYFDDESEIVNLVELGRFEDYVKGLFDREHVLEEGETTQEIMMYEKCEFSTYENMVENTKQIGYYNIKNSVIVCDAEYRCKQYLQVPLCIKNVRDNEPLCVMSVRENEYYCGNNLIHIDHYQGISYPPIENFNVSIDRGISSIFDRHIRLSEVKTLQDLEEYNNSSYFRMME